MTTLGKAVQHEMAWNHATGRTLFLSDFPRLAGELVVHLVGSPCSKGKLLSIDTSAASMVPGVVGIYTAKDVPGAQHFGVICADEAFLALERLEYRGQPIAVIAAESKTAALAAEALIRLEIQNEDPVLSVEEALARGEFLSGEKKIERGDIYQAWDAATVHLDGALSIGGQEHCYFETQAALAESDYAGGIRLKSSTQNPTEIQSITAAMLGLGMHQVVVDASTMGGGFGGKETQAALPALAAALVAHLTGRPARICLERRQDMSMTGKRHDYRVQWRVACNTDGRIQALDIQLFSNGGSAEDLSPAVLERSLLHATNAYYVPNVRIRGRVCRTNLPPNTAFRGFGAPQAVAAMEHVIESIATALGRDPFSIRMLNCYDGPGRDVTPYGQQVPAGMAALLEQAAARAAYATRRTAIEDFNRASRTHRRGISLLPVHFGISFTNSFLNQANALVNLYPDGTVQVSTGATEMGQGSNAKIRQLVAAEFGLPLESVRMMPTSTERNHNTSPTAASVSTDLNGMAAVHASRQIVSRLREVAGRLLDADPEQLRFENGQVIVVDNPGRALTIADVAQEARAARVDLGARGFYATPGVNFDWVTGRGSPFRYFTTGCAVTEVTVERSTGVTRVDRVDILMDIGRSLNPGIDRGQIIGGFVQGMGWALCEELHYDHGRLSSDSLATYKIPTIQDVPESFTVEISASVDGNTILGGKGVGEPPLVLGLSAWTAVQHALSQIQPGSAIRLDLPATPERVLLEMERLRVPAKPFVNEGCFEERTPASRG